LHSDKLKQIFFIYGFFLRGKFNVFYYKVHTFTTK